VPVPGVPSGIRVEQMHVEGVPVKVFTSALFNEGEEEEGQGGEPGHRQVRQH
jgi:hypothetical protein